jgi:hypothetical protein
MRGTHPGDVGIGVCLTETPDALATRARSVGANVFHAPSVVRDDARRLAVFMMPDRHFFEVVGPTQTVT